MAEAPAQPSADAQVVTQRSGAARLIAQPMDGIGQQGGAGARSLPGVWLGITRSASVAGVAYCV